MQGSCPVVLTVIAPLMILEMGFLPQCQDFFAAGKLQLDQTGTQLGF
jgi:hypothetical protein